MKRALALALVLSSSGCSLLLARGPRSDFDAQPQMCTYSENAVFLDYIFASLVALTALTVALAPGDIPTSGRVGTAVVGGGLVGVQVGSAIVGKRRIRRCRRAYGDYQVRHGGAIDGGAAR